MRASLLVVLLAVGCWRNTGNETAVVNGVPEEGAEKGASCDQVRDNVQRIVATDPKLAKRADQIARVVVDRCTADGWSMELRRCLSGAKTLDDSDGCEKLATPEQQKALEHEIEMAENAE